MSWCKMKKRNSQCEHRQPMEQTRGLLCICNSRCGLLSIRTSVSLLAKEFDVQSQLHWQVSLAAVNQLCVINENMNSCKKRGLLRKCKYRKMTIHGGKVHFLQPYKHHHITR